MGQPARTRVLTPVGWRAISDLNIGDIVCAPNGNSTQITQIQRIRLAAFYRIHLGDGTFVDSTIDHRWLVQSRDRSSRGYGPRFRTLRAIVNDKPREFMPIPEPMQFPAANLPLHPYLLGALIGDGGISKKQAYFATNDNEMIEILGPLLPVGVTLKYRQSCWWAIAAPRPGLPNPVIRALRDLGLQGKRAEHKFIPHAYKFASISQRLALLQGLMDTDGCASPPKPPTFVTSSLQLVQDVTELVQTLGGVVHTWSRPGAVWDQNVVTVFIPRGVPIFVLGRKARRHETHPRYRGLSRAVKTVRYTHSSAAYEISTSAGFYLTDGCVVVPDADSVESEHGRRDQAACRDLTFQKWFDRNAARVDPMSFVA